MKKVFFVELFFSLPGHDNHFKRLMLSFSSFFFLPTFDFCAAWQVFNDLRRFCTTMIKISFFPK